jgi:hypothetical protein
MQKMGLLPLCFLVSLTACAANDPQPVALIRPVVPVELLACAPTPTPPANTPRLRQSDVGRYIVDLWEAGEDCRRKHGVLAGLLR